MNCKPRRHISILGLLLIIGATAQPQEPARIPPDAIITAIVSRSIDAARLKLNDTVELEAYYPVLSKGKAAIPKGAKLTATVEVCESLVAKERESRLIIRVRRADWKGGGVWLNAYIDRLLVVQYVVPKYGSGPTCVFDGHGNCRYDERLHNIFTSPPFTGIGVKRLRTPKGATMLVSTKRNVELKKGAFVELRTVSE